MNSSKGTDYGSIKGMVFNIQRFSLHDGPGIRTTVYLKGCPLKCQWCSNPESQSFDETIIYDNSLCIKCYSCVANCPEKAISVENSKYPIRDKSLCTLSKSCVNVCPTGALKLEGRLMMVSEVMQEVLKDAVFYTNKGGITISGGEALAQPNFTEGLLRQSKNFGLHTAIETTGYAKRDILKKISSYVDLFLYDFKHFDTDMHKKYTGVNNDIIYENLKWLIDNKKEVIVRIPVIPRFNNSSEIMEQMAKILSNMGVKRVDLLPFHQLGEGKYKLLNIEYKYSEIMTLHKEDVLDYKKFFENYNIQVKIGG